MVWKVLYKNDGNLLLVVRKILQIKSSSKSLYGEEKLRFIKNQEASRLELHK